MDKERLKDLLFAYLSGNLSEEELDELLSYTHIEEYAQVFDESMAEEWDREQISTLHSENEKQKVYQRIVADSRFTKTKESVKIWRLFTTRIISTAAAVVIISVSAYLYISQPRSHYNNDVTPGSTRATLTLANGSKIPLDETHKGEIARQSGISITKTAAGQLVYTISKTAQHPEEPAYNTLETPKGGQYQVVLPDGTRVWLNAASSLTYPASFASLKERRVTLKGEAYFEVVHNADAPFHVVSARQEIEVLGTHFNINAYAEEPETETTLLEGSVKVSPKNSNTVILKPGQQAEVDDHTRVREADLESAVAWKNGDFIFKDQDFKAAMRDISRWYDVEVIYDDSAPQDFQLGGWVSRSKNISAVLKVIESTGKVHFTIEGRRITVGK